MIESGELRVRFAVPEESANSVAVGDAVRIETGGFTVAGAVEKVSPEIDAATRMIFAEASLDLSRAAKERVRSGQVARVHAGGAGEQASAMVKEADVDRKR